MMNDRRKSDRPVVAAKSSNKAGKAAAERVERRGLAKGNLPRQNTNRAQDRESVQSALRRIRQAAAKDKPGQRQVTRAPKILYVYDMLYPVMDLFMPLGNLERVEGAIDQLVTMVSADWVNGSTLYMPVTRELSAGKRLILEAWGDLVIRKYPQQPLPPISVPCDN